MRKTSEFYVNLRLKESSQTRGNEKTIVKPNFTSNAKRYSFAYRSIDAWHRLPNYVVNSESVNSFKSNIDTFLTFSEI